MPSSQPANGTRTENTTFNTFPTPPPPGRTSPPFKKNWTKGSSPDKLGLKYTYIYIIFYLNNNNKNKNHNIIYILLFLIFLKKRESGICPIREELHSQCFDEIIRQVTIDCPERGNFFFLVLIFF